MIVLQKCRKWVCALFLVFIGTEVCRSDIRITALDYKGRFARIELTGRITKSDVPRFAQLVALLRPNFEVVDVNLDSPGGDVFAAIQIGEIVRKEWLMTAVPDEPPAEGCMSACVLILAAGAVRIVGGNSRVGIHRPYFDQVLFAGLDRTQAKAKYDTLSQSVATYLAKMGMSERLHQEMMKVPSSGMRLLSYDEANAFNLSGEDAGYSEWLRAKNVAKYGEAKMKEFDAWRMRSEEYVSRCTRSSTKFDEKLWLQCSEEFSSRFPNPLP